MCEIIIPQLSISFHVPYSCRGGGGGGGGGGGNNKQTKNTKNVYMLHIALNEDIFFSL